jgi:uncharacterized repeat protein (TIGR01451 family)
VRNVRAFLTAAAALFGALLLLVSPAQAQQRISNIAEGRWIVDGQLATGRSNEVAFDVTQVSASIATYVRSGSGEQSFNYRSSRCAGPSVAALQAAGGDAVSVALSQTSTFRSGETLYFTVTAPLANRDPGTVDSLDVTLDGSDGDRERLEIFETGNSTGIFVGAIATTRRPPAPVAGDCRLSMATGDTVEIIAHPHGSATPIATVTAFFLADPFGFVFDSEDGTLVDGARVTLVDAATGQPATVFADDGVTRWPSTVISGQPITDAAGNVYVPQPGEYRFPLAPLGSYRLLVEPPAPYSAPSQAERSDLARLRRPDGTPFVVVDGSFGASFALASLEPVRIDVPLDRPNVSVTLTKTASRTRAMPGDAVFYTVTLRNPDPARPKTAVTLVDAPSPWLRLRSDSIRIDGEPAGDAVTVSPDGSRIEIALASIPPAAAVKVTYAMVVRADAPPGDALNEAVATDSRGARAEVRVPVRIERDSLTDRMTLIGRVTLGDCSVSGDRPGVPGVRVMLEDGSFALTDADGRYHFEGLVPGSHVVQVQTQTLPEGGRFVDCSRSTRSAGSAISRFVIGQGGSLAVADFSAVVPGWEPPVAAEIGAEIAEGVVTPIQRPATVSSDREAAGADIDWLALGNGPPAFLFPEADHNPRSPAIRIAIRHPADAKVELTVDGKPVDSLAFDGARKSADGSFAVSTWRGVALPDERTMLAARIVAPDGSETASLTRQVHYSSGAWHARFDPGRSRLVADGASRPVVAVRLTDRRGRPVRSGVSGTVAINEPYESALALDRLQIGQLVGRGGAAPGWTVEGDDGVALIELAPTMVSGPLNLTFAFVDGEQEREQRLESWVVPGDPEWTVIGLAEGTIGARSVAENMERAGAFDSDLGEDARVALYAKGRVLGKFLLTLAYDSAKQEADQRLLGTIDPNAYYTVFADGSSRRFDAASREKLYVRVETSTFYALYGDFVTGFDQTQLTRYQRTATGVKAEGLFGGVHVQGFAAETRTSHRRDEIQGNGLTGPYRLSSSAIVANSEIVAIEVRDRFRSEVVIDRRELIRFVDYDLDLLSGTIRFREPVLSRDFDLNPRFIVIDYEVDALTGSGSWNAGARADYTFAGDTVRIGLTGVTDHAGDTRTEMAGIDLKAQLSPATEIRAELAASRRGGATSTGWLVEAEHRGNAIDVLAYARSLEEGYGVGQQNGAETGRRKFGLDARYAVSDQLAIIGSAWHDESLTDASRRTAVQLQGAWRSGDTDLRLGVAHFADRYADGSAGKSTVIEGGATKRFLDNRLELSAASAIALGDTGSTDLPARHRFGARYALTQGVNLVGTYEIASGDATDARTLKGGVELAPWTGARVVTSLGQQDIAEFGKRSFAAFGLAQSVSVSDALTLDATIDANRSLSGGNLGQVLNPAHPVASGGHLSQDAGLFEDFTAVTLGAGWRKGPWAANARGEYRDGEVANIAGLTAGLLRQLGEGRIVGAGITWTRTSAESARTEVLDAAVSVAIRPAKSAFAWLGKLEYRSDAVVGATIGAPGPIGGTPLTVDGDATSRRMIASLSTNWSPRGKEDGEQVQRTEIGVFLAARHNFDRYDGFDLAGTTLLGGLDARVGVTDKIDIGAVATVRSNVDDGVTSFAIGPQVGFVPAKDVLVTVGYNVTGFRDRDFSAARNTDKGLFAAIRMKIDADSFGFLGLGRR